jgi:hypothetical protein
MLSRFGYNPAVTKEAKVTKTEIATGDVYKQLGQITQAARAARFELGELPIAYVMNRKDRAAAIVPTWVAEWVEQHADVVLALIESGAAPKAN